MEIILTDAGKRFNKEWIFKGLNYQFEDGKAYAVVGNNGSGKSTLLQCVAGATNLNQGECVWRQEGFSEKTNTGERIYQYFSFAAPYLDVVEEMTALEFLKFHHSFKPLLSGVSHLDLLKEVQLENAANKQIRHYSSGMKQRIKLAMAIFSETPVLLLDEPCANFDQAGFELYKSLIERYTSNRLVIVCSNDPEEYAFFCDNTIDIRAYKPIKKASI
ncbi:MAG: ABC transporter ATP-binding protein [Pseudopedobacter saltans]|uniref:ABC transporter ATP-binding protein n=1 Tax=Pseudopedobacter saltans TaxID=151895 RepID=A0A2W5GTX9_9SPHI|nr:MAG: ABC transporter ATP-binding protein [Pseudopedobacter saltans]